MRKSIFIIITTIAALFTVAIIFLSTTGLETDNFNSSINKKVKEINPKVELKLKDVNFKLGISNFKLEVITNDPKIFINDKKIDLETISFDLDIFDYLNNKNPITQISIKSKDININQLSEFINEYDFNLARKLTLKQIRKGKIKFYSEILFDENQLNRLKYFINGSVSDAQVRLPNKIQAENIKFDFQIDKNSINLKAIELIFDKIFISSDLIDIVKENNQYKVSGYFKTKKDEINLKKYSKFISEALDILSDQPINLSSDNKLSFKINNKFEINNLLIESKLNFDEIYTKSKYQDYIYLKNGDIALNYSDEKLNIVLDSKFLFKNAEYNSNESNNLIKAIYIKKENSNASVNINFSNTKNNINSDEFREFISFKNLNLPKQFISFASNNEIKFNLNKNNKIKNLQIKSKINTDNLIIDYNSQRIKKYFSNFKNQIKLSQSNFQIEYVNNIFNLNLKSKYSFNDINENIDLNYKKIKNNNFFKLNIDLDSAEVQINELDYKKNIGKKSALQIKGNYKENNEIIFNNIEFKDEEKNLLVQNLELSKNDKIKNLDLLKIDLINNIGKRNALEFKKVNNNYYLTGNEFDGTKNIKNLLDNSSRSIFSNFQNLNTFIYVDIAKYCINNDSYLSNVLGEIKIINNKIFSSDITAKINDNNKFKLNISTNNKNHKITNLEIQEPEPFIKNYKFIKGFKEGWLWYESYQFDKKTISNLKIKDFKVQEVPLLAKLLTLASLQGIADLLTGEGIRFTDFEMEYESLGNTTKFNEIYAIGPAISLMMEGYMVKNELTSLRGTLVPATTINKTISKIPMLGDILVGKKIGEGVFGVSFKIKGPPKKLKTTVNPIKTLTPRFITRTLEKISN